MVPPADGYLPHTTPVVWHSCRQVRAGTRQLRDFQMFQITRSRGVAVIAIQPRCGHTSYIIPDILAFVNTQIAFQGRHLTTSEEFLHKSSIIFWYTTR